MKEEKNMNRLLFLVMNLMLLAGMSNKNLNFSVADVNDLTHRSYENGIELTDNSAVILPYIPTSYDKDSKITVVLSQLNTNNQKSIEYNKHKITFYIEENGIYAIYAIVENIENHEIKEIINLIPYIDIEIEYPYKK